MSRRLGTALSYITGWPRGRIHSYAKATGDPEQIARFKRIFGYRETMFVECRY